MRGLPGKVMAKRNKPTPAQLAQRAKQAKAERILRTLLKTPKTRSGLIAAVHDKGFISKHFVYGWIATRRRDGTVVMLKSMGELWYQLAPTTVVEVPKESVYPSWLDPRALPDAKGRLLVVDGEVVNIKENSNKKDNK